MAKGREASTPQKRKKDPVVESSASEDEEGSRNTSSRGRRLRKRERKDDQKTSSKKDSRHKSNRKKKNKNLTPKKRSLDETNESSFPEAGKTRKPNAADESKRSKTSDQEGESSSSNSSIASQQAPQSSKDSTCLPLAIVATRTPAEASASKTTEPTSPEVRYPLVTPMPPSLDAVQTKLKAAPTNVESNNGDTFDAFEMMKAAEGEAADPHHDPSKGGFESEFLEDVELAIPRALFDDLEKKASPKEEKIVSNGIVELEEAATRPGSTNPWSMRLFSTRTSPEREWTSKQAQKQEMQPSTLQVSVQEGKGPDEEAPNKHQVKLLAPSRRPTRLSPSSGLSTTHRLLRSRRKEPPSYSVVTPKEAARSSLVPPSDGEDNDDIDEQQTDDLSVQAEKEEIVLGPQPRRKRSYFLLRLLVSLLKWILFCVTGAAIGVTLWTLWNAPFMEQPSSLLLSDDGSSGSHSRFVQKTFNVFRDAIPKYDTPTTTATTMKATTTKILPSEVFVAVNDDEEETHDAVQTSMSSSSSGSSEPDVPTTISTITTPPLKKGLVDETNVIDHQVPTMVGYFFPDDDGAESTSMDPSPSPPLEKQNEEESSRKPSVEKLVTSYIASKSEAIPKNEQILMPLLTHRILEEDDFHESSAKKKKKKETSTSILEEDSSENARNNGLSSVVMQYLMPEESSFKVSMNKDGPNSNGKKKEDSESSSPLETKKHDHPTSATVMQYFTSSSTSLEASKLVSSSNEDIKPPTADAPPSVKKLKKKITTQELPKPIIQSQQQAFFGMKKTESTVDLDESASVVAKKKLLIRPATNTMKRYLRIIMTSPKRLFKFILRGIRTILPSQQGQQED